MGGALKLEDRPTEIGVALFDIIDEFRKRARYKRMKEAIQNFDVNIPQPLIMRTRGGQYHYAGEIPQNINKPQSYAIINSDETVDYI